uniref:Uncharacterized protein n=1 Tax=viral metagenome TaxID=1070528 RepID=A0A6C0DRM4_9ZZZZ
MFQIINKPILIIQASPIRTASIVLVNVLQGLIYELSNKPILDMTNNIVINNFINNTNVVRTHYLDFNYLMNLYGKKYDVYFVCSERQEKGVLIDSGYRNMRNIIIFDYAELLETPTNAIDNIVDTVYKRFIKMIPNSDIIFSTLTAKKRLREMNNYYETIKTRPFTYINIFYGIHGSHRSVDSSGNLLPTSK